MITEDYVSFEVAKLLKDKGFNEPCIATYNLTTKNFEIEEVYQDWTTRWAAYMSAPTLQIAMKWLREVHNIAINIGWGEIFEDKFQWWCIILNQKDGSILRESEYHATYEEACEAAIKYCLENLI